MTGSPAPLEQRTLGSTGVKVPVLGLGTAPGGMGLPDAEAVELVHRAIDLGVTYLDTAPGYQRAQRQLREVLGTRRREVFLATKASASTRAAFLEGMSANLRELGVDCVDLAYIHSLGQFPPEELFARDGALAALAEVKRRGWARHVGFTAHDRPALAERALREAVEVDVVMLAMNYVDRHVYGFETRVLPAARERGVGVVAMKVYGGAQAMRYERPVPSALSAHGEHDHRAALRYALGLRGVSCAVVGAFSQAELEQNVAWARAFEPLDARELERLLERGRALAAAWGRRYGPVE